MYRISLIDADSHNFPNLAVMKLSAYYKARGDMVEWWDGWTHYDRLHISKVFDTEYTPNVMIPCNADEIICGGTGFDLTTNLPDEIEHQYPDYGLYGITDTAYGFFPVGVHGPVHFVSYPKKRGGNQRESPTYQSFGVSKNT